MHLYSTSRLRRTLLYVVPLLCLFMWVAGRLRSSMTQVPNKRILNLAHTRLRNIQRSYDAKRDERDWGLQLDNYTTEAYTRDIHTAWTTIFGEKLVSPSSWSPSWRKKHQKSHPIPYDSVMNKLRLDAIPTYGTSIPHRVYTTSRVPPEKYPAQFKYWAQNDPSLTFRHLNDSLMNEYLSLLFPPPSPISRLTTAFPKPVLKADLLRYSLMLHRGGIYTDSDTAAVRPFDEWGTHDVHDRSDTVVGALPLFLSGDLRFADTNTLPPPSLMVAIEMAGDKDDWRDKNMARGLQIVQWTIAAQPGHPVFLDVIHRALKQWQNAVDAGKDIDEFDPLEWTGPGPFTDAVFRYLMARYGVSPREFISLQQPARVGDVLILPHRAFQADASEGSQPDQACVWHGFLGSWREKD